MNKTRKTLKLNDISVTPIKLKYSASYYSNNFLANRIFTHRTVNGPIFVDGEVSDDAVKYNFLKQLYYNNYITGSLLNSSSYWDWNQQTTTYSGSYDWENRYFPIEPDSKVGFLYVSPQTYGEQIAKNTLCIIPNNNSYKLIDDGNGNLIDVSGISPIHVGNVIYSHGIITITNPDYIDAITPELHANWYNFPESPLNIMRYLTGNDQFNFGPFAITSEMRFVISEFTVNGINYITSPRYYTLTINNVNLVNTVSTYFGDKYINYSNGFTYTNLVDWINSLLDEFGLLAIGYKAQLTRQQYALTNNQKSGMGFYMLYPQGSTFFIQLRSDWGTYDIFAYGHDAMYQDTGIGYQVMSHGGYTEYDINIPNVVNGRVQE